MDQEKKPVERQSFPGYVRSGQKLLRIGITTGTCAALAAKAAVKRLLFGQTPEEVSLITAGGTRVTWPVADSGSCGDGREWASVIKDAGDDPDVTDGIEIRAEVIKINEGIIIDGGAGVGRVSKPGLQQPVGAAAINDSPRRMITEAVREVLFEFYESVSKTPEFGIEVVIVVPGGEEIAKKTFNPSLGIEGGISILGTTGIEYPMSEDAIVKSIEVELHQAAAESDAVILTPGNYGETFIKTHALNPDGLPVVRFSGYLGDALDICATEGFREVLLVSHIGKLVKTAGGIMNTHQRNADCRMELICAHAAVCGADTTTCRMIMEQMTTDGCIAILDAAGLREAVIGSLLSAIDRYLKRRVDGACHISAIMFSNQYGILGSTK